LDTRLTADTTLVIADLSVLYAHSELHHYTTFTGLKGICGTNTLWATHFAYLNDTAEVVHLQAPLLEALVAKFTDILNERRKSIAGSQADYDICLGASLAQPGGAERVARAAATDIVQGLYKFTFESESAFAFAEPFIASFCSHSADQTYERDHGLLSQWRGYGRDGGFCIVFDTPALAAMLGREFDSYYWVYMNLASVRYAMDGLCIAEVFPQVLDRCGILFSGILDGKVPDAPDDGFAPFVAGATLFKHQGFREEREVRIVAAPGSQRVMEHVHAEHADFRPAPLKVPRQTEAGRRYVALFDSLGQRLPIKRIIVGPSRDQDANYARALELVGATIPVLRSATPFVG
jgi:hypothetical protein